MLHLDAAHRDGFVRLHQQVEVHAVAAARRRSVELPWLEAGVGADDRVVVAGHPVADCFEPLDLIGRERAVAHRADVEQQVAALAGDLAQRMDQRAGRFEVLVGRVVAPAVVDGQAGFPRALRRPGRDRLLGRLVVAVARNAIIHDDFGLQRMDQVDELARLPFLGRAFPSAVEPEQVYFAVVGEELAHLGEHEVDEPIPLIGRRAAPCAPFVGFVRLEKRRVVGMMPVDERVVQSDPDAFGAERVCVFTDYIALER